MPGYIKIHRKIIDWEWYGDINTTRLFIHLLLSANFKDAKYKGKIIPRGSLATTIPKLSGETALTVKEVRTACEHLMNTGEISKKTTNRESIIKVLNYDLYQADECGEGQTKGSQGAVQGQSKGERTEEEGKKNNNILLSPTASGDKKRKKKHYDDDSREMKLTRMLSSEILKNKHDWIMHGSIQSWCDTFRLILDRDKRDYDDVVKMIIFCQWDEFWKGNILSPDKLRKHYDTLSFKREEARKRLEKHNC